MDAPFTYFRGLNMGHQIYKVHWRGIDIEAGYEVACVVLVSRTLNCDL